MGDLIGFKNNQFENHSYETIQELNNTKCLFHILFDIICCDWFIVIFINWYLVTRSQDQLRSKVKIKNTEISAKFLLTCYNTIQNLLSSKHILVLPLKGLSITTKNGGAIGYGIFHIPLNVIGR